MEAVKIIKKVSSDRLPELNKYKGKSVEITILPYLSKKNIEHLTDLIESCPNLEDGLEFQKRVRKADIKDYHSILDLRGALKNKIDGMKFQKRVR